MSLNDRINDLKDASRPQGGTKLDEMISYFDEMRQLALRDMETAKIQDSFVYATEARCYEHARDMALAWRASDLAELIRTAARHALARARQPDKKPDNSHVIPTYYCHACRETSVADGEDNDDGSITVMCPRCGHGWTGPEERHGM